MPLVYAITGFIGGYLFAISRHVWKDWGRSAAMTQRLRSQTRNLRSQRRSDYRSAILVGVVLCFLLWALVIN